MMNGLVRLTFMELKLYLREPMAVFFGIVFPAGLVAVLGNIPSFRDPSKDLGGQRVIDLYVPIAIAMVLTMLAMSTLPALVGTYRERGILRRLSTTPVPPAALLLAQTVVSLLVSVAASGLVMAVGRIAFDVALPRLLPAFVLAFLLAAGALLAVGLLVAALVPSGRTATAVGSLLFFPLLFFAGLWLPRQVMPDVLRRISDFTPLGAGVQAMHDASAGSWPQPLHLAVMTGYLVVFGLLAARTFRWD